MSEPQGSPTTSSVFAWPLIGLVAVALVPRLAAAIVLGNELHFVDEGIYVDTARRLLSGEGFGAHYSNVPAYPTLLAVLSAPFATSVVWLRLAQAVVAAFGAGLTFILAERMLGRATAIAAAVIYALDPLLVVAAGLLYPEAIAATVMVAMVLAAWMAVRRNSIAASAFTGALLGCLALFRPVALAVVTVVVPWIVLNVGGPPRRRALHGSLVVLTCLLVLAPWTYRNYRIHGRLMPVSLAGTGLAPVTQAEVERRGLTVSLLVKAWQEPGALAMRMTREFGHFWEFTPTRLMTDDPVRRQALHRLDQRLPTEPLFDRSLRDLVSAASFGLEVILALAGLVLLWRTHRREAVLLTSVVLAYAVGYALFVGKVRYRIPILPLLFLFAGTGAWALVARIRQPPAPP